jgi:penicillin-binding protein
MTVSDLSGKLPSEMTIQTKHLVTDIFNKAYVPTEKDDTMVRMKVIPYDGIDYIPQEGTPSDMIVEKTVVKREKSMNQLKDELNEVLQKLPKEDRSPISSYMPGDADLDAPTQTDPRKDDGNPPKAPGGVALAYSGDGLKITFQPGADSDVVGYRFYRSVNRGPFQRVNGKVVLSGQDTVFYDKPTDFGIYGYYVTAVDVAGKESSPSRAVYSDGSVLEANMVPGMHDSGEDNRNPVSGAPSIPAGLTIKKKGAGIELSWKANPDSDKVKRYNIYYSEKANGEYKRLGSATNSTQFQYFALVYDGYYRISAVNDAGESKASEPVSFKK